MIQNIEWNDEKQQSVVTLIEGFKHKYQDGDVVKIREVKGMLLKSDMSQSINNTEVKIKAINPSSFYIDLDVRQYTEYEGNGTAKQVKVPVKVEFKTLEEVDKEEEPRIDANLAIYDFEKMDNHKLMHIIYNSMFDLEASLFDNEEEKR